MNNHHKNLRPDEKSFLKQGGITTTASFPAPYVLTSDKARARLPVTGTGNHQYEVIHDWGKLPAGHVYGNTHGMAIDAQGEIHIKHTVGAGARTDDAVVVFNPNGKFIRSWGKGYKGGAHGLHLSRESGEEFFYLCDPKRHLITKTTLAGKEIWRMRAPETCLGYSTPDEYCPTNIATAPNGDFFAADGYGKSFIHQYDRNARYLRSFGGKGAEPGRTNCPHGLMVDLRGATPVLVVADRTNRRLQNFALDGQRINFVTDEIKAPCHFHVRSEIMVISDLESRVTLFDKNNRLVAYLGEGIGYKGLRDQPRDRFTPGQFVAPHAACFDSEGNIFVVEWVEVGRVTKLQKIA